MLSPRENQYSRQIRNILDGSAAHNSIDRPGNAPERTAFKEAFLWEAHTYLKALDCKPALEYNLKVIILLMLEMIISAVVIMFTSLGDKQDAQQPHALGARGVNVSRDGFARAPRGAQRSIIIDKGTAILVLWCVLAPLSLCWFNAANSNCKNGARCSLFFRRNRKLGLNLLLDLFPLGQIVFSDDLADTAQEEVSVSRDCFLELYKQIARLHNGSEALVESKLNDIINKFCNHVDNADERQPLLVQ